ncbi:shikimate kinase [Adlercreutzia sp. ZJ154]|uniref:shikimate kinase n=1 Tax=Adlercreutzia sp. ZJ154 TaxID=2709790 RepID=UPI0013EDA281|nr:shikimate kinase [Adlercreutzia sp. ZJ154]
MKRFNLSKYVFLIGFMGAGKTTISRRLSRLCGLTSIDLDSYIERMAGMSISEIFADSGERVFRETETQALRDIVSQDEPMIVSCGGGVVTTPINIEIMKQAGVVVHLLVDVDEAASRITDKSSRPLFQDLDAARTRFAQRLPIYEAASDFTVDTFDKNTNAITHDLRRCLQRAGVLVDASESSNCRNS